MFYRNFASLMDIISKLNLKEVALPDYLESILEIFPTQMKIMRSRI